jgi:hypothetical protein
MCRVVCGLTVPSRSVHVNEDGEDDFAVSDAHRKVASGALGATTDQACIKHIAHTSTSLLSTIRGLESLDLAALEAARLPGKFLRGVARAEGVEV